MGTMNATWPASIRQHPQRRRALIIGAGPTGMSAAFHLGEHSVLLERRHTLEHDHDHSHDFPMGSSHGGVMGGEDPGADGHGLATLAESKALFISCSSHTDAGDNTLIHVERWRPPEYAHPEQRNELRAPPSIRTLRPLLRGELRLDAHVIRVSPSAHLLELADGHRYVYDKLVSTLSIAAIEFLVATELPRHADRDESLRFWLGEHDIEVVDRATQDFYGDLDGFAAGRRVADKIGQALAAKFGNAGRSRMRGTRLFEPRLVTVSAP
jgi:hypothetical protein